MISCVIKQSGLTKEVYKLMYNIILYRGLVWCDDWPQSLICAVVKCRLASLALGWVTTRFLVTNLRPTYSRVSKLCV